MPLAIVRHRPGLDALGLGSITFRLPFLISSVLSATDEGAGLKPEDVEVEVRPFGERDTTQGYAFTVVILANDYPGRRKILEAAARRIGEEARRCFPSNTPGFVWILLAPAAFYGFGVRED